MQAIRSDLKKLLWHGGRPHMGPGSGSLRSLGRGDERFLASRQSLEGRHALGDMMESLLVDGEDRHLRAAIEAGIVERADLQNHRGQTRPARKHMGAAFSAKFPRHGALEIAARKLPGRSLGLAEAAGR